MDEQLKERVVGAAVLVLAAVILVPMLLSGPEPDGDPSAQTVPVPRQPQGEDFSSRIVPLKPDRNLGGGAGKEVGAPDPAAPRGTADAAPASGSGPKVAARKVPGPVSRAAPEPQPAAVRSAAASAARKKAKSPAAKLKLSKSTAPSPGPAAGWVVQLGSFSNKRNAVGLKERLVKKGYRAFVETTRASGSEVTRVYVGPEQTRDQARARLPGLYQETKLKGIVTRYEG